MTYCKHEWVPVYASKTIKAICDQCGAIDEKLTGVQMLLQDNNDVQRYENALRRVELKGEYYGK